MYIYIWTHDEQFVRVQIRVIYASASVCMRACASTATNTSDTTRQVPCHKCSSDNAIVQNNIKPKFVLETIRCQVP